MSVQRLSPISVALGAAAVLSAAATLAILGTVVARVAMHASVSDFLAYYTAGYLVRTGQGVHLYDPNVRDATERVLFHGNLAQTAGYPLPVFAAWLFAPLSELSFTNAFFLYMALTAVLLVGLLWVLNREPLNVPKAQRLLFACCAALTLPSLATIVFGQVDFIALGGLIAGYLLLRADRRGLAGLALCLVMIKPQLVVGVALLLLVSRDWRTIRPLAAVGAALLVVPALLTGPGTLGGNIREVLLHDSRALASAHVDVMANWRGFIVSLTGSDRLIFWAPGFIAIAAGATALAIARWRSAQSLDRDYSIAVLLPLLVSPHVHTQNLVVMLLPAALALRAYLEKEADAAAQARATNAMLLAFTLLFVLPFMAIQGLSLTVFFVLAVYLAISFRWPAADRAVAPRDAQDVTLEAYAA